MQYRGAGICAAGRGGRRRWRPSARGAGFLRADEFVACAPGAFSRSFAARRGADLLLNGGQNLFLIVQNFSEGGLILFDRALVG